MKIRAKQLLFFARSLGLSVRVGGNQATYHHERGRGVITLPIAPRSLFARPVHVVEYAARDLAHELGHYLVATFRRRQRRDYGIPEQPKAVRSRRYWDTEEAKALMVEYHLRAHFGDAVRKNAVGLRLSKRLVDVKAVEAWFSVVGRANVDAELKFWRAGNAQRRLREKAWDARRRAREKAAILRRKSEKKRIDATR